MVVHNITDEAPLSFVFSSGRVNTVLVSNAALPRGVRVCVFFCVLPSTHFFVFYLVQSLQDPKCCLRVNCFGTRVDDVTRPVGGRASHTGRIRRTHAKRRQEEVVL